MSKKLNIVANVAAVGLLGGALFYYNVIDKVKKADITIEVGQTCLDFTAKTYRVKDGDFSLDGEEFSFSAEENTGKVYVFNFWETWCPPCIQELPEFNEAQIVYGDSVEFFAFAGFDSQASEVTKWLNGSGWESWDKEHDWREFSLKFAYMSSEQTLMFGCTQALPRTVIVNKNGVVTYARDGKMSYQQLTSEIEKALQAATDE